MENISAITIQIPPNENTKHTHTHTHTIVPLSFILHFCKLLLDWERLDFLSVLSFLSLYCTFLHLLCVYLLLMLLLLLLGVALSGKSNEEPLHHHQPLIETGEGEGRVGCFVGQFLLFLDQHLQGFVQLVTAGLLQVAQTSQRVPHPGKKDDQ